MNGDDSLLISVFWLHPNIDGGSKDGWKSNCWVFGFGIRDVPLGKYQGAGSRPLSSRQSLLMPSW